MAQHDASSPSAAVAPKRRCGAPRRRKERAGRGLRRGEDSINSLLAPALLHPMEEGESFAHVLIQMRPSGL